MLRSFLYPSRAWLFIFSALFLYGCAGVKVNAIKNDDYLTLRRGDVLTTGSLRACELFGHARRRGREWVCDRCGGQMICSA